MPTTLTIGELRKTLTQQKARWSADPNLRDEELIRPRHTGASTEGLRKVADTPALDLHLILKEPPANPFLVERRKVHNLLPEHITTPAAPVFVPLPHGQTAPQPQTPPAGAAPAVVDWRNRWGWPWITTVQDQDGCNSCWAFAATALVETMVRIDHCVWSKRSEADVHDGMGAKCADLGSSQAALDWIKLHGITDEESYPYKTNNPPYTPTPDRSGRIVKIDNYSWIGDTQQQKIWLDTVGPIITWFDVYDDFFGYHAGVYHRLSAPSNKEAGGHLMLVVGYDDNQKAWIVKNSWGTSWGQQGYCLIGYGECGIDQYAKIALQLTNPDPWTKHRLHNGNLIESGNGPYHRNFEMLDTTAHGKISRYWRDETGWHQGGAVFGGDAASPPTAGETTFNRNFEGIYLTAGHRLHHFFYDQAGMQWRDGGVFGPSDASGVPGFLQSDYGKPGNFEVVVRTANGQLNHWWRMNAGPWTWFDGGRFGSNILHSGASLLQARNRNLQVLAVLTNGTMQRFWRDDAEHTMLWHAGEIFGDNCSGPPCMIEGQFGCTDEHHAGNYEVCVPVNHKVQHWWKDNYNNTGWHLSTTFAHDVAAVHGLLEGSYGFNLEVIVLRTDGQLQHYWRAGGTWYEGAVIGSVLAAVAA